MFKSIAAIESLDTEDHISDHGMPEENLFEASCDLHEDHAHITDLRDMSDTAGELESLQASIEAFGVSKSLLSFANKGGYLAAAIPAIAACEALADGAAPGSPEAQAALEGIVEKTKEVAGAWFKKAWDIVTGLGDKIVEFSVAAYHKAAEAAAWVGQKTFDAAKAAKDIIVAHPVATAFAALAFITAGTTLMMGMWGEALPATAAEFSAWVAKQGTKVADLTKSGWSKVATHGGRIASSVKKGTGDALEYTGKKFGELTEAVKNTFKEGGKVNEFGKWMKTKSGEIMEKLKTLGGDALKYGREALTWLVTNTGRVWHSLCSSASAVWTSVLSTFKRFFGAKTGESVAEAAARQRTNRMFGYGAPAA